ncbi:unnamed protein product [Caenorhabditis auriculariae]|uniref:Phorbol-ester/DAG-type domain-containing protein n=1 Tax=Caenorhabditis auriculariae TaxID=2777116 RepID=A0A8S1GVS1_9PELO|nr:unnamed protein product [Caenorhabditis auriculariae]
MSSYCSSEGGFSDSFISSPRKSSFLKGEDDNVVDREINDVIETFRRQNPSSSKIAEIDAALDHCRRELKELLQTEAEQSEEDGSPSVDEENNDSEDVVTKLRPFLMRKRNKEKKQMYFDKIVQLGLERQNLEENEGLSSDKLIRSMGHEFEIQPMRGRHNPCCEVCMHTIWRLVQTWRRCRVCGLRAHDKCTESTRRLCSGVIASRVEFAVATSISEEQSLADQDYKCAECSSPICYDGPADQEPRLCDYSGELYCPNCHWMDTWSIPARVIHNLDAAPRPVCRAVKHLLAIVDRRPLITIDESHASLIKFHKELRRVSELRRHFLVMKCYFISCRNARKIRILQYLNQHSHFVDSATSYSLKELRDLCNGTLLSELEQIFVVFRKHIEEECETCKGNGFFCELCEKGSPEGEKVLYPFTEDTRMCKDCLAVFHRRCFEKRSMQCPRCERRKRRSVPLEATNEESVVQEKIDQTEATDSAGTAPLEPKQIEGDPAL